MSLSEKEIDAAESTATNNQNEAVNTPENGIFF